MVFKRKLVRERKRGRTPTLLSAQAKSEQKKGACVDGLSVYFYTDLPGVTISRVSQNNDLLRSRISSVLGDPNTQASTRNQVLR